MSVKSQAQFLTWLKNNHPGLYSAALERAEVTRHEASTLSGLGADESLWSKIVNGVSSLGTTYLALRNQKELLELNLERAKAGQPPLDAGATAPVVRTQIDLPPHLMAQLQQGAADTGKKVLIYGGAALLGFIVLKKMKVIK